MTQVKNTEDFNENNRLLLLGKFFNFFLAQKNISSIFALPFSGIVLKKAGSLAQLVQRIPTNKSGGSLGRLK